MNDVERNLEDLLRPEAYPGERGVGSIEMRETHISWLFFTADHVYKVKKPVNLGFVNYSSLPQRRQYCEAEIRLNRRHSRGVYLGVVGVVQREGGLQFEGEGQAVDAAVKMKRLSDEERLPERFARKPPDLLELQRIGRFIADFHRVADVVSTGGSDVVFTHCRENDVEAEERASAWIPPGDRDRIRIFWQTFFASHTACFAARESQGFIRDGHGDLHAENIFLGPDDIQLIDCVEFSAEYRVGDTIQDLAFLLMDLDARGYVREAEVIADEYFRHAGDDAGRDLLNFYKVYRACIRGKIAGIQAVGGTAQAIEAVQTYYGLAAGYAVLEQPQLLVCSGLMGSGKSTLARELAARLPATHLQTDVLRHERFSRRGEESLPDAWNRGAYTPEHTAAVYAEMFRRADAALHAGNHVILDASFCRRSGRERARALAKKHGAAYLLVWVECPDGQRGARLDKRSADGTDASEGRVEIMQTQRDHFDFPEKDEWVQALRVSTTNSAEALAAQVLADVYQRWWNA